MLKARCDPTRTLPRPKRNTGRTGGDRTALLGVAECKGDGHSAGAGAEVNGDSRSPFVFSLKATTEAQGKHLLRILFHNVVWRIYDSPLKACEIEAPDRNVETELVILFQGMEFPQLGIPFTQVRRGGGRRSCDMGREGQQPPAGRGDERAIPELVSAGG